MRAEDFDFELPPEQIAQEPLADRQASRLLVVRRGQGALEHRTFAELPALLSPGDLLVVNDSRVVPARLLGRKAPSGGRAELLLVGPVAQVPMATALQAPAAQGEWLCLGQASKGFKVGQSLELPGSLRATVRRVLGGGQLVVAFEAQGTLLEAIRLSGVLPLPPYIERAPTERDLERYQTIFAAAPGSVAAPTAGLHFTPQLVQALGARGVQVETVTLEVGPGTFLPVRDGDVEAHRMHPERYLVPERTAEAVDAAKREGRRVVAVGTTVVRTLESAAEGGRVRRGPGQTTLFIRPGFRFQVVDALVTNFHLPRSTLLMLVCAFWAREPALAAYREAVTAGYRFFSYGDAMFLTD